MPLLKNRHQGCTSRIPRVMCLSLKACSSHHLGQPQIQIILPSSFQGNSHTLQEGCQASQILVKREGAQMNTHKTCQSICQMVKPSHMGLLRVTSRCPCKPNLLLKCLETLTHTSSSCKQTSKQVGHSIPSSYPWLGCCFLLALNKQCFAVSYHVDTCKHCSGAKHLAYTLLLGK